MDDGSSGPSLTVIIPTYRRTSELQRAIRSVLALEDTGIEIIIVDDGSAEVTEKALAEFEGHQFTLLLNHENKGVSATRNHGASRAHGTWLWFFDSDDEIVSDCMQDIKSLLHDDEVNIIYFHAESRQPDGDSAIFESQFLPKPASRADLLTVQNRPFTQSQFIVRKSSFNDINGFDESIRYGEDLDLWVRLINADSPIAYVPRVMVIKHEGSSNSLSFKTAVAYENSCRIWRKHADLLRPQLSKENFWDWQFRQLETRYYVLCDSKERIRSLRWSQRIDFCWRWMKLAVSAQPHARSKAIKGLLNSSSSMLTGGLVTRRIVKF